jgi:hypothetical protein
MDKMIGRKFGRLKIISETSPPSDIEYAKTIGKWYNCQCKCDGKIIPVSKMSLLNGSTSSCGCLRSEIAKQTLNDNKKKMIANGNDTTPKSKVRYLEFEGEKKSLSAWAKELGITKEALRKRLKTHTVEESLTMKRGIDNGN